MKNKLSIILTVVLALSITVSITVCAQLINEDDIHIADTKETEIPDNSESKSYTNEYGVILSLKYTGEEQIGSRLLKKYVDEYGNEYTYDEDDELVGVYKVFNPTQEDIAAIIKGQKDPISEDEAIEIADNYARYALGEKYGDYTYYSTYSNDSTYCYITTYRSYYGESEFISGPSCSISVSYDGKVSDFIIGQNNVSADFDLSLLDSLTKEDVNKYFYDEIDKIYIDDLENYNIEYRYYMPTMLDGKPYIVSRVGVINKEKTEEYQKNMDWDYLLGPECDVDLEDHHLNSNLFKIYYPLT